MKIKFITFFSFIIVTVCTNLYAQTPQKSAAAQEADKLSVEVVKLFRGEKFSEAEPIARRVISIREKELGKNAISVAEAWRNLGYIHVQLENSKEAGKSFDKALEIYEKNQPLSPANEKIFVEMLEASAIYDATDQSIYNVEKKFLRANELREKISGKDSLEIANNLMKLGQIYRVKNDYEKSSTAFFRALKIRKQKLDVNSDQIREALSETSCIYGKLGRKDELSEIRNEIYPKFSDDKPIAASANPRQIAKGVVNGAAISLPRPAYPSEAREKLVGGSVNVEVFIDESGNVLHACAVSGAKELHLTSEIAAYGAKFKPTTLSGVPVKVMGVIVYNYVR